MIVLSANTESVADHFSILLQILAAQVDFSIGSVLDEIRETKRTGPSKVKI